MLIGNVYLDEFAAEYFLVIFDADRCNKIIKLAL